MTAVLAFEEQGQIIPHAGGYSDYLGRRTKTVQAKAEKKKQKPKHREKQPRTDRLSYKQTYLLSTLPDEIEALTTAIAQAEARLADMDFFAQDPDGYQKLAEHCATDKQRLNEAEQQWLELEILREELEDKAEDRA